MQVIPHTAWDRFEALLERAGEYLNPILVKESRQALKSKQFIITFTLVLICGWAWSLLGVAYQREDAYYAPIGPFMLIGYFWVLAFPLLVIVPFAAFRSLASEREDGTYELLSITTLWPRQIIAGKLGSALLQMIVYLSALAPCVAFTYLLRGIDIISILLFVAYVFMGSLLLSMTGLLVATVSRARHWQIVLSVVMILSLAIVYLIAASTVHGNLNYGPPMALDQPDFWIGHLVLVTAVASSFVLLFLAAAARISFASDNRSTKLRLMMMFQQTLLTGWCVFYALRFKDDQRAIEAALIFLFILSAIYWIVVGSIMCGENPQLSQRVRRSLPQSLLARTLLTWFNPGPGTGYLFAIGSLLGVLALGFMVELVFLVGRSGLLNLPLSSTLSLDGTGFMTLWNAADWNCKWLWCGVLTFCYVTCYLGIGRVILLLARRAARVGLFVSFLLQIVLLLLGAFVPWAVQMSIFYENGYTALQVTNWFWTVVETLDGDILSHKAQFLAWTFPIIPGLLLPATGFMILLNLFLSAGDATHERQAAPGRVMEDERALHPERPTRLSPWDEPPPEAKTAEGGGAAS